MKKAVFVAVLAVGLAVAGGGGISTKFQTKFFD
jgi:hypothetical protein